MENSTDNSSLSVERRSAYTNELELDEIPAGHTPTGSLSGYHLVPSLATQQESGSPKARLLDWTRRLSRRANWGSFWIFELGAVIFSLVFMIAIIVVLKQVAGQPASTWRLPLAPNTLIAVFATLSKAMLLVISECLSQLKWVYFEQRGQHLIDLQIFDDASRGPIGAVQLLFRIRWRAFAASFAALLTVLALAQDAFYQEIYSTYTDNTARIDEVATVAWARALDMSFTLGHRARRELSTVMMTGVSAPREPKFECPSGNCTWPPFDSLGVCSSCEDVTQTVSRSCQDYHTAANESDRIYQWVSCDYAFNDALTPVWIKAGLSIDSKNITTGTILNATIISHDGADEKYSTSIIVRVGVVRIDQQDFGKDVRGMDDISQLTTTISPVAHVCDLTWCVKHYGPTMVTNGRLVESILAQTMAPNMLMSYHAFFELCQNATNGIDEDKSPKEIDVPVRVIGRDYSIVQGRLDALKSLGHVVVGMNNTVLVSCSDVKTVTQETDSFLAEGTEHAYIYQSLENFILEGAFNNDALWGFLAYIGHLRDTRNKLPQLMYSATDGNITLAMENVARSLTNQIRSGPQSMDLSGTVSRTEVYMRVQWQSLAYPTTLLFLASILLFTSMLFSAERSRAVWKSSSIATLFHGLQGWSKDDLMRDRVEEIENDARSMRVKLQRDQDGHLVLLPE